ncbi:hypothetical protein Zmor_004558 [Zophobas morio]|uniref:Uncharacterized protein n=1 Tax=Zophobas morio TaxID=2755281 RepID=A0AA38ILF3_9CUCU|nr:hypothetical protein Zmor_004558 [Zophobas morio]
MHTSYNNSPLTSYVIIEPTNKPPSWERVNPIGVLSASALKSQAPCGRRTKFHLTGKEIVYWYTAPVPNVSEESVVSYFQTKTPEKHKD